MSQLMHHENLIALADLVSSAPLIVLAKRAVPGSFTVLWPLDGPGFKPKSPPFQLHRARWTVTSSLKGELWPGTTIEVNAPHWQEMKSQQELFCHAEYPVSISPMLVVTRCAELPHYDGEDEALLFLSDGTPGSALELWRDVMAPVSAEATVRAVLPKSSSSGVARPWWQFW